MRLQTKGKRDLLLVEANKARLVGGVVHNWVRHGETAGFLTKNYDRFRDLTISKIIFVEPQAWRAEAEGAVVESYEYSEN